MSIINDITVVRLNSTGLGLHRFILFNQSKHNGDSEAGLNHSHNLGVALPVIIDFKLH